MLQRPLRTAVRLAAFALLTVAVATPAQAQTSRRVFVLAGQSNTWDLRALDGTACASPGTTQVNVSYWEAGLVAGSTGPWSLDPIPIADVLANAYPMLTLGNILGGAFPNEQVELVMIAQSASALLWRNYLHAPSAVNRAWIDPLSPSNPFTWTNEMEPVMNALALTDADALHIVWGQGESDALPGMTTTTLEYMTEAQHVFAELAADAGKSEYEVHLVTLGAVYTPLVNDADWNRVRDAFFGMPSNVLPLPGVQATIRPAAHHYDLEHRDLVHLTACESVALASRIADGILTPSALPLRSSAAPSILGTTDIVIPMTVALAPMPFGQSTNKFFEVTVGTTTLSPSNFWVATSANSLIVRVKGVTLTATNFSVRYVAGTGDALDWETMPTPVDAALGLPLEPFIAP